MIYLINLTLLLIIIYFDFHHLDSSLLKWLCIFNNFFYSLIKSYSPHLQLALLFTVTADYFLIFTNHQIIGVICFLCVQYNYMHLLNYYTRNFLFPLLLLPINPLISISLAYIWLSLGNLCHSFLQRLDDKHQHFFFLAILLLAICDLLVALTFQNILSEPIFKSMIWIFYVPSQLFLLSSQINLEK